MRNTLLSAEAAELLAKAASATTGEGPLADVVEAAEAIASVLCDLGKRIGCAKLRGTGMNLGERLAFAHQELERLRACEALQDLAAVAERDLSPQVGKLFCALLDDEGWPRARTVKDLLRELWPGGVPHLGKKTAREKLLVRFRDLLRRANRELLAKYDSPLAAWCIHRPEKGLLALRRAKA